MWEVDLGLPSGERIHSIVVVLPSRKYKYGGLGHPGFSLLDGRKVELFMTVGQPLPDAWVKIA